MFQDVPDSSGAFQELGQPEGQPETHLEAPEHDVGAEPAEQQGFTEAEAAVIPEDERQVTVISGQQTVSQPPRDQGTKLGDQSKVTSKQPSGNPADTTTWRITLENDFIPNLNTSAD